MSSSAVLVAVIVLCMIWGAPRVARRAGGSVQAQVDAPDLHPGAVAHTPERQAPRPSTVDPSAPSHIHERETTAMDTTAHAPTAGTVRNGSLAGLRIRWDRTIVFLAGLTLVLAALLTALAAPFTAVTWAVPVVFLLLGTGCVAGLRYLAVTDRAGAAVRTVGSTAAPAQHAIFDNEDATRLEHAAQEQQAETALDLPAQEEQPEPVEPVVEPVYTVAELRAEALKVARTSTTSAAATWEPVPVPKPLYTQAPVVKRPAPEPLRVPQRPAAKSASLKDAVRAGEQEPAALNLDDVLKRRRA